MVFSAIVAIAYKTIFIMVEYAYKIDHLDNF